MITLQNINKRYRTDTIETTALNNINLQVDKGEFLSIMGPSGCGKSTLLNALLPEARQQTKAISDYSAKGVHTTTFAELFFLPGSGDLIDTPGIKEFGILDVADEELSHFFQKCASTLGSANTTIAAMSMSLDARCSKN